MRISISIEIRYSQKNKSKSPKKSLCRNVNNNQNKVIHDWCEAMVKEPDKVHHDKP